MPRDAPAPSSPDARARMQAQPSWDTKPELALRRELHRRGLRYFVHRRPVPWLRRQADVLFPGARVAVFVDSCWWHGCPEHVTWPRANADWWRAKIGRNRERDADTNARLMEAGWLPIRVWEHEEPSKAAERIQLELARRRDCPAEGV
jgi:DNA mismatch endonuclease, patch repair protein